MITSIDLQQYFTIGEDLTLDRIIDICGLSSVDDAWTWDYTFSIPREFDRDRPENDYPICETLVVVSENEEPANYITLLKIDEDCYRVVCK